MWLTQAEAARAAGVSWRTMHRWVHERRIPSATCPVTGHPRIAAGDLDAHLTPRDWRAARYSRQANPNLGEVA